MATESGPLLQSALGQRVQFIARVSHFSTKRHWSGLTQATIVLENIRFAANGAKVLDTQTFNRGIWDVDLYPGYEIVFEGRWDTVEKRNGTIRELILRPSHVRIL